MRNSKLTKSIVAMVALAVLATTIIPTVATAQSTTALDTVSLTDKRLHRRAIEGVF